MNKQDLKKLEEYDFLIEFKKTVAFDFDIIDKDRESPDFVISYKNQNIGVEVTKYFIDIENNSGSRIKRIESDKDKIINNALNYYSNKPNPPFRVYINFVPSLDLKSNNRDKISKVLCDSISGIHADVWERIDILKKSKLKNLSRYFSSVYALRLPENFENYWTCINFGFVVKISEKTINDRIRQKEEKIEIYKKVTSQNWLLLVSDGRNPSSMVSISDNIYFEVKSKFDKVFFLTYPETRVFELR